MIAYTPRDSRDPRPVCGKCRDCHPGRSFGGDSFCRAIAAAQNCACHALDNVLPDLQEELNRRQRSREQAAERRRVDAERARLATRIARQLCQEGV